MGVGGVGSGNQPVDNTGGDSPSGPTGTGNDGSSGASGADGANAPGNNGNATGSEGPPTGESGLGFGEDFGFTPPDPTNHDETSTSDTDTASRSLCNTIALRCTEDASARNQILGSHDDNTRANEGDRAENRLMADSDTYRSDTRATTRTSDLGDAFRSGDRRVIDNVFKSLMGGGREGANPTHTANPTGTPVPNQPTGNPTGTTTGKTEGNPNPTGTPTESHPPLLPGATGRAATLTQPRLDQLGARIAGMPNGEQKTQAQQLETRLRAAIASGNHEEASQIMDQLAAMGVEVGGEESTEETHEDAEVGEGEGADGEGGGEGGVRRGGDGERPTPRTARTHMTSDTLNTGVTIFHSGGGEGGERYDVMTRSRIGIETLVAGRGTDAATRLSTDAAVRGVLEDNPGNDDSAGGGSRGSSADTGPMIAGGDGTRRMSVVDAPGPLGNFAVRDERTGRIYGMYDARLGADVMPGVRDYTRVRTRIGAEAISGASAANTGELWAGMRC